MTDDEIQKIISFCRIAAGTRGVTIPVITIDRSEIAQAISGGTAIATLTNKNSEKHASMIARQRNEAAPQWACGRVMIISDTIIKASSYSISAIGVIVHETGHAYNIAAGIANTEAHAQAFEIDMLLAIIYSEAGTALLKEAAHTSETALDGFFKNRLNLAYLANGPSSEGYVLLHKILQTLPKAFKETLKAYDEMLPKHLATHQKRIPKQVFEPVRELEGPQPEGPVVIITSPRKKPANPTTEYASFFNAKKLKSLMPTTDRVNYLM